MKVLQEVTNWEWPNHIYFTNDSKDKVYAYVRSRDNVLKEFNKPIKFSGTGRKFKEVDNTWNYVKPEELPEGFVKIVLGSKGERYTITEVSGVRQCSCPGFKFRGKCRHTEI